jgi:hypothetical protein
MVSQQAYGITARPAWLPDLDAIAHAFAEVLLEGWWP